jgi:hypothetical protein
MCTEDLKKNLSDSLLIIIYITVCTAVEWLAYAGREAKHYLHVNSSVESSCTYVPKFIIGSCWGEWCLLLRKFLMFIKYVNPEYHCLLLTMKDVSICFLFMSQIIALWNVCDNVLVQSSFEVQFKGDVLIILFQENSVRSL